MAPMLTLSFLYEDSQKASYLEACEEWLAYAMHDLPRTGEGGYQHITIDSDNFAQLWDDTLYMTVLFVARMGRLLQRDDCVQESIRQFLVHIKYLQDPVTGLFYHGWTFAEKHHYAGAFWGRGNAWYTAGLVDYLELAEIPVGVKMFPRLHAGAAGGRAQRHAGRKRQCFIPCWTIPQAIRNPRQPPGLPMVF